MPRDVRADRLIEGAKARCVGCRRTWRLNDRHEPKWTTHRDKDKTPCTAQEIRAELRAIAAEMRALETTSAKAGDTNRD